MQASTDRDTQHKQDDPDSAAVGIAYAFGGIIVGGIAMFVTLMIEALTIAFAQGFAGVDVCAEGFSLPLTIGLVAWGVAISLFIGYTLFRWRRFVGTKSDSDHGEFAAMIRKRFTWASMITYCLLAPFSWLFILAMAFCSGNH